MDGGWSKRSHKHSYNAKSGVAIIIGKETGRLLFIGVRNKYCHACALGMKENDHACFRNWNSSSSEMETDIVLEGFLEAERVHGVRYTQFVGDGDSSVYPTLLTSVPGWGHTIKKIECANHACKCYRGALEKLVQDNPSYKGSGRFTKKMRQKLVSAARCAIQMRSKETDAKKAVELLNRDLLNKTALESIPTVVLISARSLRKNNSHHPLVAAMTSQHPPPAAKTSQHPPPSSMRVVVRTLLMKLKTTLKVPEIKNNTQF